MYYNFYQGEKFILKKYLKCNVNIRYMFIYINISLLRYYMKKK